MFFFLILLIFLIQILIYIGNEEDEIDDGKSQSAVEMEVYSRALDSNVEVMIQKNTCKYKNSVFFS